MTVLLIALDCPYPRAMEVIEATRHLGCGYKFGLRALLDYRFALRPMLNHHPLMLDLKLFDTPDTVRAVCEIVRDQYQPQILTVHPAAAAAAAKTAGLTAAVVSVPLLSSEPADSGASVIYRTYLREAEKVNSDGFVCAVPDLPEVKRACHAIGRPGMITVCPGVRLKGGQRHNHQRTGTPDAAAKAGADFIVVGRPIIESPDPGHTAQQFATELIVA